MIFEKLIAKPHLVKQRLSQFHSETLGWGEHSI